ncbi:MAG: serine protease [Candidatus Doudnabacteria bacterium]|nr:serine protease [Candidatus Doudnabacteria bacterium]
MRPYKSLLALKLFLTLVTLLSLPFGSPSTSRAFDKTLPRVMSVSQNAEQTEKTNQLAQTASPAVVLIRVFSEIPVYRIKFSYQDNELKTNPIQVGTRLEETSSGSAFFIRNNGYLLTNYHVISDSTSQFIAEISETEKLSAHIAYTDPENDLAILKVDGGNFPSLTLGNSSEASVGENIVGIGNALGIITDSVSLGKISALKQNIIISSESGMDLSLNGLLETNSKLYPGDSGGPLLNMQGQVVGINVATTIGADTSYFIPINMAKEIIIKAGI